MKPSYLSALCLLLFGACAITNVTIAPPPQEASVGHLSSRSERTLNLVVPLEDGRVSPHRCGIKKNTWNMHTATVFCSQQPNQWLGDLLAAKLRESGFNVLVRASPDPGTMTIEGKLLQFFVEPKMGAFTVSTEADIHIRLVVTSASGLVATRDFFVKGEKTSLGAFDGDFQAASDDAARHIVQRMTEAIVELLDRAPQFEDTDGRESSAA